MLLLMLLMLPLCWSVEVKRPRGVSLTNHHFYDKSKPFTCLDGSATIPFDQVNDDYCDCKDGSDEPGTAACPNGNFHCTNTGYKPLYIPSSRVNDGICDCCDGTDEYNSGTVCENTCKEKGLKERESLQQMAEVTREGFRLKKILVEDWKKAREEKQKKLTELQAGKKSLEDQVEALRALKEEAEKPEKEAKEQHQRLWEGSITFLLSEGRDPCHLVPSAVTGPDAQWEPGLGWRELVAPGAHGSWSCSSTEQQAAVKAQREQEQAADAFRELDDDMDGVVSVAELQTHPELDTDGDGTVSEGEAQSEALEPRAGHRGTGRPRPDPTLTHTQGLLGGDTQTDASSFYDRVWASIRDKYRSEALLGGDTQTDASSFYDRVWASIRDKYRSEALPADLPAPLAPEVMESKEEQPSVPTHPTEYEEEEEEETEEEEEDEEQDSEVPGEQPKEAPSPLEPSQPPSPSEEDKMPPYDEQTQAFIDAAQEARSKFEEAERSLKDMEESIRNLEQEISFDFGPQGEFAYLYSQCYELSTNEYIYRLCPFKLVSQKPKLGGSPTNLGVGGPAPTGPREHPVRLWSCRQVRLLCGKETAVTSTTEPSRCEYLMELSTPAACPEPPPELPVDSDHDEL
ncbi:Glucosidase 2 subunit beta [Heterocephalus glaber]|uniref:Glucosidase 2 subunit beta n=1 Tax=Heterocephalus glaber TaxID=10181 RepID=G5BUJ8_HETGA|nr:Glucosidase 2 subunit beta [Heterocephalus glaber]